MFALMILLAIGIYLLMSIWVVSLSIGHARKHQLSVKKWGWGAVLVMFLIPFWDWLPTVAVHKYYCEKEAGFWVYKTLEQWKAENPRVAETLVANKQAVTIQNGYELNQRFNQVVNEASYFPLNYMMRREERVVDSKTGEVLARYVDYSATHIRRQAGWSGWKFWLDSPHCSGGAMNGGRLASFTDAVYLLNDGGKQK